MYLRKTSKDHFQRISLICFTIIHQILTFAFPGAKQSSSKKKVLHSPFNESQPDIKNSKEDQLISRQTLGEGPLLKGTYVSRY